MMTSQKKAQKKSRESLVDKRIQVERLYGHDFNTIQQVCKYAFGIDKPRGQSVQVYLQFSEGVTVNEFKKAVSRWSRIQKREEYSLIVWGTNNSDLTPCDE